MNRFRKEELRKHHEERAGLSSSDVDRMDNEDAVEIEVLELTKRIHIARFPEEYDHMYDSVSDARVRASGTNPMSDDYITEVNVRRTTVPVMPLSASGVATSSDSWEIAYIEADRLIRGTKE